jgi:lipoprotein-anchoring transpeptidase ErfK/SrfK
MDEVSESDAGTGAPEPGSGADAASGSGVPPAVASRSGSAGEGAPRRPRRRQPRVLAGGAAALAVVLVAVLAGLLSSGLGQAPHRAAAHGVISLPATPSASPTPPPVPSPAASTAPAAGVPPPGAVAVPPPPPVSPISSSTVVYVNGPPTIQVYAGPDTSKPMSVLKGHNSIGQPEAFLVVDASTPGWYQVLLPVAPNGTKGWVQAGEVQVATTGSFLLVSLSRYALYHYENGRLVGSARVAVGRPTTPTPTGLFYIWASQAVSSAPYNPGIFALNGFTDKPVPGFLGASLGVHGWTDPSVIGTQASNGCVRVATADFRPLLDSLILGTPVEIVA